MASMVDDVKDSSGNWRKGYSVDGEWFQTKSSHAWYNMKSRCKIGGSTQKNQPTYIGCTYSSNFSDFQYFAEWHTSRIGYGVDGYHLDKDLLVKGNKEYNEDICVLIPQELNKFLCDCGRIRGQWPQGVSWNKVIEKFFAQISIDGKSKSLGYFTTSKEAHEAYKIAKTAEAKRWHQRLVDGEFIVDPRVIERMRTWEAE